MAQGTWSDVFAWPIVGIHAILTPDGKVLTYGTDKSGQQGAMLYLDLWDPVTNTHQTVNHRVPTDLFCSSCVIVPSTGEILIAGGDSRGEGGKNEQRRRRRQRVRLPDNDSIPIRNRRHGLRPLVWHAGYPR